MFLKLIGIVFLSPLITMVIGFAIPGWFVSVAIGYPVIVVASLLLVGPVHLYIRHSGASRKIQVLVVSILGFAGGCLYVTLALKNYLSTNPELGALAELALPFIGVGVVQSLVMWVLYTFGPLKIAGTAQDRNANPRNQ